MADQTSLFDADDIFASLPIREQESYYGPTYKEIESLEDIAETSRVISDLESRDWSFTSDGTSYLSHDVHPYPAKYIPQLPGNLIARLSVKGEVVLDPFGGSGTTALEAIRLRRRVISIDANPLSEIIGRVKTAKIDKHTLTNVHQIRAYLSDWLINLPVKPGELVSRFSSFIPDIPNRHKWFPDSSCGELALIRSCLTHIDSPLALDIASLALSRVVLKVSFQDSETRYTSKPREIAIGETLRRYIQEVDYVLLRVMRTESSIRYGLARFITGDTRELNDSIVSSESIDLIVTSPPYANAFDYHLYHRFRLLWLGFDPKKLGIKEIGSHLRHQREKSDFSDYLEEMRSCFSAFFRVLKPGRFAALVVGDAIYDGKLYSGAASLGIEANTVGFETVCILERPIHRTKRSMVNPGRRADTEKILVVQKPVRNMQIALLPPPYKLWPYEEELRKREIEALLGTPSNVETNLYSVLVSPFVVDKARALTFTHHTKSESNDTFPTWQAIVENGLALLKSSRKDPKYVTHGLHPYKGKFYPQLAKSLLNITRVSPGGIVFDPFCGSGTTLLESYLNGLRAVGTDMNPLASKVARAKIGVLEIDPSVVSEAVATLLSRMEKQPKVWPSETEQFRVDAIDEIQRWFAEPIIAKLNWLLRIIRSISAATLRDFFEVLVSSIVRDVSQQEPTDLRIRRRNVPLNDADVVGLFRDRLLIQYGRIEKFWASLAYCPTELQKASVFNLDSRDKKLLTKMGVQKDSVDVILTSPPYATALPYIDTDRLSLLVLDGLNASDRRPLEYNLIGSREINTRERVSWEVLLSDGNQTNLPSAILDFVSNLHKDVTLAGSGFRRRNVPALLMRFFVDMGEVLINCRDALRQGGECLIVIGDNVTTVASAARKIPTVDFVGLVAESVGLELIERIPITVTVENLVHSKNSITNNVVLRMRRA